MHLIRMRKIGIVLVTHGSLSEKYVKEVNKIAELVHDKLRKTLKNGNIILKISYLHHQDPNPEKAIQELLESGVEKILVFSLFVVEGRHGREDVEKIIEKFKNNNNVVYTGALWPDMRIIDIIIDKLISHI